MHQPSSSFRVITSVIRKDILEWLHQPRQIFVTILPTFGLFIVLLLGAAAVGRNKVALVVLSNGPYTDQMVQAIETQNAFVITPTTADEAAALIKGLRVEAVITIPADFESKFTSGLPDPIGYEVNNLNLDFTNDLRRSLPDTITGFYASQPNSPIKVVVNESDLRLQDIDLVQFQVLPLLVQLLTAAGVLNTGLAAAREWETLTIKELYQAPINRRDLIIGKTLAGWLITMFYGFFALIVATLVGLFHPQGIYWLYTIFIVALVALASAGLGVTVAAILRKEQRVIALSTNLTFYLFFLSGGISVIAFLPAFLQTIAQFVPTYYGVHALQMAVFYNSADLFLRDSAVLVLTALVMVSIGAYAFNRRLLE
jgi:ABC-type multidrug transport system permease subunit